MPKKDDPEVDWPIDLSEIWPPVIVEWTDAASEYGDFKLKDITTPLPVRKSIGFMVQCDMTEVRIVGVDDRSNALGSAGADMLRVPAMLVKSITFLKEEADAPPQKTQKRRVKKTQTRGRQRNHARPKARPAS